MDRRPEHGKSSFPSETIWLATRLLIETIDKHGIRVNGVRTSHAVFSDTALERSRGMFRWRPALVLVKSTRGSLLLLYLLKIAPKEEYLLFKFSQPAGMVTQTTREV